MLEVLKPYLTFSNIVTVIAFILIIVGLVGMKIINRYPKETDRELEKQMEEHEREIARRSKEDKELDDYLAGSQDEYI